jgi:hypothetical protein
VTILDAICEVLKANPSPQSTKAIHDAIVARSLFTFGAKDPMAMVRSTIRRHLRESEGSGGKSRVKATGKDLFTLA